VTPFIPEPLAERRQQILAAAMICFARCGFHLTTMHDISHEAGISVGLIYRYFENKEAVIAAMAEEHRREIESILLRARQAPTLFEALEILFTSHCCENAPQAVAPFVVDLFAEAGRNPHLHSLTRRVVTTAMGGVTELIEQSTEYRGMKQKLAASDLAELIFAVHHGSLMHEILETNDTPRAEHRKHQMAVLRNLWRSLFACAPQPEPA
jgi:AcrR family transcriptional regulator